MKETTSKGTTRVWYAVDKDGWGKLYHYKPERQDDNWQSQLTGTGTRGPEPDLKWLLLPSEAKRLGRTWKDEPCKAEMEYKATITINEEQ